MCTNANFVAENRRKSMKIDKIDENRRKLTKVDENGRKTTKIVTMSLIPGRTAGSCHATTSLSAAAPANSFLAS
jgi:hypothetical protein